MRVLVTGGTGFVGGHLVEALRRQGHAVTALVRSPDKAAPLAALGATLVSGDLHTIGTGALEGIETVYHLAGLTAARNQAEFQRVNVDGTANLLKAASAAGVGRFVFVSSLAAAGPAPAGHSRTLDDPAQPVTDYGRSKAAAEAVVRAGQVPWVIVRPPAVYGPSDVELLKVFKIARLGTVPIFGDGSQSLSLVFGPDLAESLIAAGWPSTPTGRIYYPAHPEIVTSGELVRIIGTAMGKSIRLVPLPRWLARGLLTMTETGARLAGQATLLNRDKLHEFFAPAWTCDPTPLTEDTSWRAAHDIQSGVEQTLAWYRTKGWL